MQSILRYPRAARLEATMLCYVRIAAKQARQTPEGSIMAAMQIRLRDEVQEEKV